jgi:YhhN family
MFALSNVPAPWGVIDQIILLLIAALLVGSFALNGYDAIRAGRMPKSAQLPQSALLVVLAATLWMAARDTKLSTLAALLWGGMAFGFLGDLFMANVLRQKNHVMYAIIVFAVGHVLYMLAFREIAVRLGLHGLGRYALAMVITWGLALVLWFALIRDPKGRAMQYDALVYALFLASMAGFALGLALQQPALLPLAVGAVLFLLSDTLIAARLFAGRTFPYTGDVIWTTYIAAQTLIVTITAVVMGL